jgi:hypothetical protein
MRKNPPRRIPLPRVLLFQGHRRWNTLFAHLTETGSGELHIGVLPDFAAVRVTLFRFVLLALSFKSFRHAEERPAVVRPLALRD